MHELLLNAYRHRTSPIHRLSPLTKLLGAVAVVSTVVLLPRAAWAADAGVAAGLLAVALLTQVPLRFLGRRLLLVEPFAVGVALLALFQADGWRVFLALLTKSTLCLFGVVLLSATTRFTELLLAFRRLRVPSLLVIKLALMHRYLYVLAEERSRLLRARRTRTLVVSRQATWRLTAGVAAQLFLRTSERAERVYAAMCARGWRL